jgi:predicted nucleotidyltransferase
MIQLTIEYTGGIVMTKDEILMKLSKEKNNLQENFDVERIGLFGSYAKDQATKDSDIDFYVEFKKNSFRNIAGLWIRLEEMYNKKIDLLHKHKQSKGAIFDSIQKEVIYG